MQVWGTFQLELLAFSDGLVLVKLCAEVEELRMRKLQLVHVGWYT